MQHAKKGDQGGCGDKHGGGNAGKGIVNLLTLLECTKFSEGGTLPRCECSRFSLGAGVLLEFPSGHMSCEIMPSPFRTRRLRRCDRGSKRKLILSYIRKPRD